MQWRSFVTFHFRDSILVTKQHGIWLFGIFNCQKAPSLNKRFGESIAFSDVQGPGDKGLRWTHLKKKTIDRSKGWEQETQKETTYQQFKLFKSRLRRAMLSSSSHVASNLGLQPHWHHSCLDWCQNKNILCVYDIPIGLNKQKDTNIDQWRHCLIWWSWCPRACSKLDRKRLINFLGFHNAAW